MNECRTIAVTDTTEVSIETVNVLVSIQTTKSRISSRYVPTNRRDILWLRPYKQEGNTVASSLQTGQTYRGCVPKTGEPFVATSLQTRGTYHGCVPKTGGTHRGCVPINRRDIPWLSHPVSGLSPLMSGVDPRLVYMGFMVNKVALSVFPKHFYFLGHAVAHFVEALRYELEGHGFDSRWCH